MTIQDVTPTELRRDPASDLRFAAMRACIVIADCAADVRSVPQFVIDAEKVLRAAVTAYDEAVRA